MAALLAAAILSGSATAQVWVDPLIGSNSNPGTPSQPWQTITYAMQQIASAPQAIYCYPGVYDQNSGEQFPIICNPYTHIEAVIPHEAKVDVLPGGVLPSAFVAPSGTYHVMFVGMNVSALSWALDCTFSGVDNAYLDIADCKLSGGGGLRVNVTECDLLASVARSVVNGGNDGARLIVGDAGVADFWAGYCLFKSPGFQGFDLSTDAGATVNLRSERNVFPGCGRQGLRVDCNSSTTASIDVVHCVFWDCGTSSTSGVGILDASSSSPVTWNVLNTAFWDNDDDIQGVPASSVSHCVMEFPVAGTSIVSSDPMFVAPANDDFHLAPGSPAVEAGASSSSLDIDDDPTGHPSLGPNGVPDIGVDEHYDRAMYVTPNPVYVYQQYTVTFIGPPGLQAYVAFGSTLATVAFGNHEHLQTPYPTPTFAGTIPSSGVLTLTLPALNTTALVGVTLYAEAIFYNPATSGVSFSYNFDTVRFKLLF